MGTVCVALAPAVILSVIYYGAYALIQYVVSAVACVFFEWVSCKIRRSPSSVKDGSALLTGILLAMCLPPFLPFWMTFIGAFISIVIGKMVFGGLGQNPFNPALVGRTALLVSFLPYMTAWHQTNGTIFSNGLFIDAVSGATVLGKAKDAYTAGVGASIPSVLDAGMNIALSGSMGEVSSVAILLGGLFLIYKKIISWHIPAFFIGSVFVLSGAVWLFNRGSVMDPLTHILSGGVFLGAFFMATDYSSSPLYNMGKILFAIGCGIITVLIRLYGGYPEGVGFAILIMNAFVPLLDKYFRPKPYGVSHE